MQLSAIHDFARLFAARFGATRCPQVAASLAFTTLLALVPLLTVAIALFSNFPGVAKLGLSLKVFLLENLLPDRAGRIITTYALQFSQKAAGLTLIGTALLVAAALMLLLTINRVFDQIWGVRRPRPLFARLSVYWFALTLGPIALGAGVVATGHLVATSAQLAGRATWLADLAAKSVPFILLASLFSLLYYAVPNHRVRPLHAFAGGVAAAAAFVVMQQLFGLFIARFPTYTLIYGTFAVLPIFLVWLYLSWLVILLGALIAATIPTFLDRDAVIPPFPGQRAWAALTLLLALAEGQRGGPLPFAEMQAHSGLTAADCEDLLGAMSEEGWVVRTEDGHWVLCRQADDLRLAEIVERFALSSAAWDAAPGKAAAAAGRLRAALTAADATLSELRSGRTRALAQIG